MTKSKEQYDEFTSWAEDLKQLGFLHRYEKTVPVSPFTSKVCGSCYDREGSQVKSRKECISYHDFECRICGKKGNLHANAGQVSNHPPFPLSTGSDGQIYG